ncbi:TPA: UDP-N-acetylmuramoyl-tripeptide--D-alanyl-D-alanine ligase [Candidatus Gracilibacteria bacterium]|nr:UDP-N-acetylmuramoyl-tripeptide--D-alanyl-D-alanine ligase [Candidatus Gracilibacteria bacterium]
MIKEILYIFQSEHYDRIRFLRFIYTHLNWFGLAKRGNIDWTKRVVALFILTFFFLISIFYFVLYAADIALFIKIILLLFTIICIPLYLIVADFILSPFVKFQKNKILQSAKKLLQTIRKNKQKNNYIFLTIGITGSYGKTTIKTILHSLLKEKYNVFLVPGNINTDLGVANYLLKNTTEVKKSDIVLLEMGAFCIGEIASICNFIQPDYSFLTAIGNQHLERFGSHKNIQKAKFEIVEATTKKAFINTSDSNIKNYLPKFISLTKNILSKNLEIIQINTTNYSKNITQIQYLEKFSGISLTYNYKKNNIKLETKLIADHIISSLYFCLHIAEELELSEDNIISGIKKLDHVPHRLEVIKNKQTGVTVIDDSYNGNFDGFISGLKTLSRATGRKIVLTPGIVELGNDAKKIHKNLANIYPQYIDVLLVILNKNTDYMLDCLRAKHTDENLIIITYKNVNDAHSDLANVLKKGDTILFQNDLSDNY